MTAPFLGTTQVGSFPVAGIRPRQTKHKIFISSDFWTVPPNVYSISITMTGGGGGGGGGGGTNNNWFGDSSISNIMAPGGSGGSAGAVGYVNNLSVIPNTRFLITIGAAGARGNSGSNQQNGGAGGSGGITSIVGDKYSFYVSGGIGGNGGRWAGTDNGVINGPSGVTGPNVVNVTSSFGFVYINSTGSGAGGSGRDDGQLSLSNASGNDAPQLQYTLGGSKGSILSTVAGNNFGGSGGGGGSNLFFRGGTGGRGASSVANTSTIISASLPGQSPSALFTGYGGYGAGGGGGGGAVMHNNFSGPFIVSASMGGNGGSGYVEVTWEE